MNRRPAYIGTCKGNDRCNAAADGNLRVFKRTSSSSRAPAGRLRVFFTCIYWSIRTCSLCRDRERARRREGPDPGGGGGRQGRARRRSATRRRRAREDTGVCLPSRGASHGHQRCCRVRCYWCIWLHHIFIRSSNAFFWFLFWGWKLFFAWASSVYKNM